MEESEAMNGNSIDSSIVVKQPIHPQHLAAMPESSQTARAMALIAYDKGQLSKSINLSTQAAQIWHSKRSKGDKRSVSTKHAAKKSPKVLPQARMEAAWRYMANKKAQVEKNKLEAANLFSPTVGMGLDTFS